jgi:S1-C subfamily serine protease
MFFAASCILLSPVIALAAPVSVPKLPKAGQSNPATTGLKQTPDSFEVTGNLAGKALAKETGEDSSTTRGAAEAAIYRRVSPSVVLVMTKEGFGTGSLINANGTIITSYHVVEGYSQVGVLFKPRREGDKPPEKQIRIADVIKFDEVTDLALIKLRNPPKKLPPPVVLGNINTVAVGEDVNAIGHPTGETWTYTRGYVSQVRRGYEWKWDNTGIAHKADVIQTQTPINPGNSGGPLLNKNGELVGINAFKDDGEGLNFAVAVTTVREFMKRKGNRGGEEVVATTGQPSASAAAKGQCKPQVTFKGRDDKSTMSIVEYDSNCDGIADLIYTKPDDASEPVRIFVDEDENGEPEGVILSFKRNDFFNVSYWDSNGDGKFDTVGYHPDGSIKPSSFGPYIEPDKS